MVKSKKNVFSFELIVNFHQKFSKNSASHRILEIVEKIQNILKKNM